MSLKYEPSWEPLHISAPLAGREKTENLGGFTIAYRKTGEILRLTSPFADSLPPPPT